MRNTFLVLAILTLTARAFSAGPSEKMRQFILGFEFISENTALTDQQRGAAFKRLKQLTGIQVQDAIAFVKSFHDRPDAWKSLQEKLSQLADRSFPAPKVTARAGANDSAGKAAAVPVPQ